MTADPPISDRMEEKCGTVSAKNMTLAIIEVLVANRFQVKSETSRNDC